MDASNKYEADCKFTLGTKQTHEIASYTFKTNKLSPVYGFQKQILDVCNLTIAYLSIHYETLYKVYVSNFL